MPREYVQGKSRILICVAMDNGRSNPSEVPFERSIHTFSISFIITLS